MMNSSFSSCHPGAIHAFLHIILVQNSQRGKEWKNSVPQTAATTFAISFVYILLLCVRWSHCRYKPVIVFEGVAYIVTWALLLWGKEGCSYTISVKKVFKNPKPKFQVFDSRQRQDPYRAPCEQNVTAGFDSGSQHCCQRHYKSDNFPVRQFTANAFSVTDSQLSSVPDRIHWFQRFLNLGFLLFFIFFVTADCLGTRSHAGQLYCFSEQNLDIMHILSIIRCFCFLDDAVYLRSSNFHRSGLLHLHLR